MQCAEGSRADFRFVRAAFRNDKRSFLAVKLPLDRLRHRKLDIIEGIAGLLHDIVIDSEYFIRKRLSGWIEDGHELIADTVSDGHAEGIEIRGLANAQTSVDMTTQKAMEMHTALFSPERIRVLSFAP